MQLEMTRRDGTMTAVRTNIEKGAILTEDTDSRGSEDGIKVVTVVTQKRTNSNDEALMSPSLDDQSRSQSLAQSDRGFFRQL